MIRGLSVLLALRGAAAEPCPAKDVDWLLVLISFPGRGAHVHPKAQFAGRWPSCALKFADC